MKILVLNCGSSSVKFQLLEMVGEQAIARGIVERIGQSGAGIHYRNATEVHREAEVADHDAAISLIFELLLDGEHGVLGSMDEIDGIGHRVVHGAERFSESALISDEMIEAVRECIPFAPLHNPPNLIGIEAASRVCPHIPQVGVFDTVFHSRMPKSAYLYALPYELYEKLGIRRYGFHGTSHRYVMRQAAKILGRPVEDLRVITCHLGNGASVAAVDRGISVDTSMGFTPLEGLVMGTRCGDLDPAILPYLMKHDHLDPVEMDNLLNKKSGLLGITGDTNDMREIEEQAAAGSERHELALDIFCRRVKKYVGAYAAVLGGADAIVFTGGIGENSPEVRRRVAGGLGYMGATLDEERNGSGETLISAGEPAGSTAILVIPTNEELAIARDTAAIVESSRQAAEEN
jgi:acetate kinase